MKRLPSKYAGFPCVLLLYGGVTLVVAVLLIAVVWEGLGRYGNFSRGDLDVTTFLPIQHRVNHSDFIDDNDDCQVKCDEMNCLFNNLFYYPDRHEFILWCKNPSQWIQYTAHLIQPGIGWPSEYFYIDTWSFNAIPKDLLLERQQRLKEEQAIHPDRQLQPIFISPILQKTDQTPSQVIYSTSILLQVLWPRNFFRCFYAGAMAMFTLYHWNVIPPSSRPQIQVVLLDEVIPKENQSYFQSFLQAMTVDGKLMILSQIPKSSPSLLFKTAILGLHPQGLLGEIEYMHTDPLTGLRSAAYRYYADIIKSTIPKRPSKSKHPLTVAIIVRKDHRRKILNLSALYHAISHWHTCTILVVALEEYSFEQQIELMNRVDVLIATHGAGLTNMVFLKMGAIVMEIFPFGFKKSIYRNLAALMGVHYVSWQCLRPHHCSWPDTNGNDDDNNHNDNDDNDKSSIASKPIDWNSQPSKNYWRNQSIRVDLVEFKQIFRLALIHARKALPSLDNQRYLMYMPWEQFNNQLIGFKCACALAQFLGRVLVVPPVGYRTPLEPNLAKRMEGVARIFAPKEYTWRSWSQYFDPRMLEGLPCQTVPFDAFTSLTRRVGVLRFRRLGQSLRVNKSQLADFYFYTAKLEYEKVGSLPINMPLYLNRQDVYDYLDNHLASTRVLCLGSTFWLYAFNSPLEYPVRSYIDKLGDSLYYQITKGMQFHPQLVRAMEDLISVVFPVQSAFNALHLRRGDYGQKCFDEAMGSPIEDHLQASCYQKPLFLLKKLRSIQRNSTTQYVWFVATNDRSIRTSLPFIFRRAHITLIMLEDLLKEYQSAKPNSSFLPIFLNADPIELAIFDQMICIAANEFIGNLFSSFTRTIVEQRKLRGKASLFF